MSSCCRPACPRTPSARNHWDDSDDDEWAGDQGRRRPCLKKTQPCTSGSDDMIDVIVVERSHRQGCEMCPSPNVCEPRPSCSGCHSSGSWQQKILRTIEDLYCFWKRFCKDPFKWEILKSGLLFTLGLRLFREMCSQNDVLTRRPKCIKKSRRTY